MSERFQVSSSPHIHSNASTTKIMLDVIIALLPAGAASVWIFGWRSALLIGVCAASCVVFEWLWCVLMKKPVSIKDLSAVVTGVLLAYNLPSSLPIWQAVLGCLVAIVVVKQLFGGLGCNFANPAIIGRIMLTVSFAGAMTNYGRPVAVTYNIDALSGATPLAAIASGADIPLSTLFWGNYAGVLGETCSAALLLGGIYLIIKKVINPVIPLSFIGAVFVLSAAAGLPAAQCILSGGLMLGAIFMATDYVTSPYTNWGKLVFGVGCGALTVLIRVFANSAEGVSFAILIMNLLVPYINDLTRRRAFGGGVK